MTIAKADTTSTAHPGARAGEELCGGGQGDTHHGQVRAPAARASLLAPPRELWTPRGWEARWLVSAHCTAHASAHTCVNLCLSVLGDVCQRSVPKRSALLWRQHLCVGAALFMRGPVCTL